MTFSSKREWRRARRAYVRSVMRYRDFRPPAPNITASDTRDNLIVKARKTLERVQWKKNDPVHPMSPREVRQELADVSILRAAAMNRTRIDPTGRAFYVTVIDGHKQALLYGPFGSHLSALRALPVAKSYTLDAYPEMAFASFGTGSMSREYVMPGVLNSKLPPILENV